VEKRRSGEGPALVSVCPVISTEVTCDEPRLRGKWLSSSCKSYGRVCNVTIIINKKRSYYCVLLNVNLCTSNTEVVRSTVLLNLYRSVLLSLYNMYRPLNRNPSYSPFSLLSRITNFRLPFTQVAQLPSQYIFINFLKTFFL
jgi:hypothetical protein